MAIVSESSSNTSPSSVTLYQFTLSGLLGSSSFTFDFERLSSFLSFHEICFVLNIQCYFALQKLGFHCNLTFRNLAIHVDNNAAYINSNIVDIEILDHKAIHLLLSIIFGPPRFIIFGPCDRSILLEHLLFLSHKLDIDFCSLESLYFRLLWLDATLHKFEFLTNAVFCFRSSFCTFAAIVANFVEAVLVFSARIVLTLIDINTFTVL